MRSRTLVAVVAVGLTVSMAGCGGSDDPGSSSGKSGGTLVFGTSADPVSMDGAYVSDGESLRVIDQIFETLVTTKAGGTDIEPKLAETFYAQRRRQGVDLQAAQERAVPRRHAVQRQGGLHQLRPLVQLQGHPAEPVGLLLLEHRLRRLRQTTNADVPKTSLYASCAAPDDGTAVINLTAPSSVVPGRSRAPGLLDRVARTRWRSTRPTRSPAPARPRSSTAPSAPRTRSAPGRSSSRASPRATSSCWPATTTTGARRPSSTRSSSSRSLTARPAGRRSSPATSRATTSSTRVTSARSRTSSSCCSARRSTSATSA